MFCLPIIIVIEDDQDEYEVDISKEPIEYNYTFFEKILMTTYGRYLDGHNIHIGGAYFKVDLVVTCALHDINNNPKLVPEEIIDRLIAYFQT